MRNVGRAVRARIENDRAAGLILMEWDGPVHSGWYDLIPVTEGAVRVRALKRVDAKGGVHYTIPNGDADQLFTGEPVDILIPASEAIEGRET